MKITRFEPTRPHSKTTYLVGAEGVATIEIQPFGTMVRFDNGSVLMFRPEGTTWAEPEPTEPLMAPTVQKTKEELLETYPNPKRKGGK